MSTFIEKMLGKPAGTAATVTPNYIVINDGVSHRAVDEITAVADRERVWVIYDHDVPTGTPQGSDRLKKNLMFAKKYGCRYIQAKGVGYQYMLNCVVKPGEIVIGAGSMGVYSEPSVHWGSMSPSRNWLVLRRPGDTA